MNSYLFSYFTGAVINKYVALCLWLLAWNKVEQKKVEIMTDVLNTILLHNTGLARAIRVNGHFLYFFSNDYYKCLSAFLWTFVQLNVSKSIYNSHKLMKCWTAANIAYFTSLHITGQASLMFVLNLFANMIFFLSCSERCVGTVDRSVWDWANLGCHLVSQILSSLCHFIIINLDQQRASF